MRRPALLTLALFGALAFMLLGASHAASEEFELEESEVCSVLNSLHVRHLRAALLSAEQVFSTS